jgi:hypothetical protein
MPAGIVDAMNMQDMQMLNKHADILVAAVLYFSCGLWEISYSSEWQNPFSRHNIPVACQLYMSRWLRA